MFYQLSVNLIVFFTGQAHYQIRSHNLSRQELAFGRRDHDALLTSFDDAKKILNLKNIFNEAYRFNMRCLHPAVVPIQYAILYMLQSGSYILSPDFISSFKKMDLSEAQVLWNMVFSPQESTLQGVLSLLFDARSYGLKVSLDYSTFMTKFSLLLNSFRSPNAISSREFIASMKSKLV
jgi:hypothetical protein